MLNRLYQLLLIFLIFSGCSILKPADSLENPASLNPDSEIAALLNAYRPGVDAVMDKPIAVVKDTLRFDKPESALGNMAADALRFRAALELRKFVHLGIIGEGSFKTYLIPGTLTLGDVYEFMPYENHLVILQLKGDQVIELIDQVASVGGAPVSGARFRIDADNRARGLLVNAEVVDLNKEYLVATSSWAANGGDQFPALWNAAGRIDLDLSVKDLYVDFFQGRSELYNETDGRIR
tara:strand:+ start:4740 stop:5450 length:711 start_codon:yes stop_codon:yes gene_type:complete